MNTEDQQKLEHFISLLRSHVAGEKLQFKYPQGWDSALGGFRHACWEDFNPSNWRVKPDAPKVQPWTFETAPDFAVKAKRKESGNQGLLVFLPNGCLFMMGSGIHDPALALQYDYKRATEELEQLDGSPCGIEQKEESEWPKWAYYKGTNELWECKGPNGPITFHGAGSFLSAFESWDKLLNETFGVVEIPATEAERIMSEAKEGVTK